MGSLHGTLHAQTRQLAKLGQDRNQPIQPAMPGSTQDGFSAQRVPRRPSPGREDEPRPRHHQLEVHTQRRVPKVRLQQKRIHLVRDLGRCKVTAFIPQIGSPKRSVYCSRPKTAIAPR
jgi:hypothetical protein